MEIYKLVRQFEKKYPLELQEDWDNSGFQLGNKNNKLKSILISLDLEYETIKKAIEKGSNLIINHHPLFFNSIKRLDFESDIGKKVELLIKNDITVYAAHTNLDIARGGINDNLSEIIGLKNIYILEDKENINMVRCGYVDKIKASEFAKKVKDVLNAKAVIIYGNSDKFIEKVAVCGGAGGSFIEDCINEKCDLIITSDIKYHEAIDSAAEDIIIVDPGHFASENHIIYKIKEDLKEITQVPIYTFSKEDNHRSIV